MSLPMPAWFVIANGTEWGPLTPKELADAIKSRRFHPDDLAFTEGMKDFKKISDIPSLRINIRAAR